MTPFTPIIMAVVFLVIFTKDLNSKSEQDNKPKKKEKPHIVVVYGED